VDLRLVGRRPVPHGRVPPFILAALADRSWSTKSLAGRDTAFNGMVSAMALPSCSPVPGQQAGGLALSYDYNKRMIWAQRITS
jgi:hypothetical protein